MKPSLRSSTSMQDRLSETQASGVSCSARPDRSQQREYTKGRGLFKLLAAGRSKPVLLSAEWGSEEHDGSLHKLDLIGLDASCGRPCGCSITCSNGANKSIHTRAFVDEHQVYRHANAALAAGLELGKQHPSDNLSMLMCCTVGKQSSANLCAPGLSPQAPKHRTFSSEGGTWTLRQLSNANQRTRIQSDASMSPLPGFASLYLLWSPLQAFTISLTLVSIEVADRCWSRTPAL
ncbi:hypothetical protein MRB53_039708 [Persea americana]|nr:hypothetical protein MRB53_039708 [Persea americana]